jgi:hypothetical protein
MPVVGAFVERGSRSLPIRLLSAVAAISLYGASAAASPLAYQAVGRASVVQAAVAGVATGASHRIVQGAELRWLWGEDKPADFGTYDATLYSYSVDLLKTLAGSDTVDVRSTNILVVSGVPDASGKAAWLFNTYAPPLHTQPSGATAESIDPNQNAAALQAAIWESMLDSSNDLLNGTFRLDTTGSIRDKARAYLAAFYAGGPSGYNTGAASWFDLQSRVDALFPPGARQSGSLALAGTGIALVTAVRRRRAAGRSYRVGGQPPPQ